MRGVRHLAREPPVPPVERRGPAVPVALVGPGEDRHPVVRRRSVHVEHRLAAGHRELGGARGDARQREQREAGEVQDARGHEDQRREADRAGPLDRLAVGGGPDPATEVRAERGPAERREPSPRARHTTTSPGLPPGLARRPAARRTAPRTRPATCRRPSGRRAASRPGDAGATGRRRPRRPSSPMGRVGSERWATVFTPSPASAQDERAREQEEPGPPDPAEGRGQRRGSRAARRPSPARPTGWRSAGSRCRTRS